MVKIFKCATKDRHCYVCGLLAPASNKKRIDRFQHAWVKLAYVAYFQSKFDDRTSWAPDSICRPCHSALNNWFHNRQHIRLYKIPVIWRNPVNHEDCFFCHSDLAGLTRGHRDKLEHYYFRKEDIINGKRVIVRESSASMPVRYGPDEPTREFPSPPNNAEDEDDPGELDYDSSSDYEDPPEEGIVDLFDQKGLNDFLRRVVPGGPTVEAQERATSMLKERNMTKEDVRVTEARERHKRFEQYFSNSDGYVYCHDIEGLLNECGSEVKDNWEDEWRLSIDSNKKSLKCLLLHNDSKTQKPSIPVAYGTADRKREDHQSMQTITKLINYKQHRWQLCSDLKVTNLLNGLKGGRPRFMCIYCLWPTTSKDFNIKWGKEFEARTEEHRLDKYSVKCEAAVDDVNKFWVPPLHVQLGAFQELIRTLLRRRNVKVGGKLKEGDEEDDGDESVDIVNFLFQVTKRSRKYIKKTSAFTGPEIKLLVERDENYTKFVSFLDIDELAAFLSFLDVRSKFLGNERAPNYLELMDKMCKCYMKIRCSCTYKLHLCNSHPGRFPPKCGAQGEQQCERAHQEMAPVEKRKYKSDRATVAQFVWNSVDESGRKYKRKMMKRTL